MNRKLSPLAAFLIIFGGLALMISPVVLPMKQLFSFVGLHSVKFLLGFILLMMVLIFMRLKPPR